MAEENQNSVVEQMTACIKQFKDMNARAEARIEKLAELSMVIEDELKQKEYADRVTELFNMSNQMHDKLEALISDYEIERNRIKNESE